MPFFVVLLTRVASQELHSLPLLALFAHLQPTSVSLDELDRPIRAPPRAVVRTNGRCGWVRQPAIVFRVVVAGANARRTGLLVLHTLARSLPLLLWAAASPLSELQHLPSHRPREPGSCCVVEALLKHTRSELVAHCSLTSNLLRRTTLLGAWTVGQQELVQP